MQILVKQLLLALLAVTLVGCGSSSSSETGAGVETLSKTIVKGNISSSSFRSGGLGGISVAIADRVTSTDSRGQFQLIQVPAGKQNIIFSKGGERAKIALTIRAGHTLMLSNIRVGRNSASGTPSTDTAQPLPPATSPAPTSSSDYDDSDENDEEDDHDEDEEDYEDEDDHHDEEVDDDQEDESDD